MVYTEIMTGLQKLAYGSPGIAETVSYLYCFTQLGCVLRFERAAGSAAESCSVECSLGGGTYGATYSFAFGDVVEADITGLLRPLAGRAMPSATPAAAGTAGGTLTVTFYAADGATVATTNRSVVVIDGVGMVFDNTGLRPQWPAEIVLGNDLPGCPVTLPATDIGSGSGSVEFCGESIDNCGLSGTVLAMPGDTLTLVSDGDMVASSRMVPPQCDGVAVTLVWWSPVLGGWKSWGFEITGEGAAVDSLSDFVRNFAKGRAADGRMWWTLRAPQVDRAQWEYLRDILCSDEVIMAAPVATSIKSVEDYWLHLVVDGEPGEWRYSERKDISLHAVVREVAGLW